MMNRLNIDCGKIHQDQTCLILVALRYYVVTIGRILDPFGSNCF